MKTLGASELKLSPILRSLTLEVASDFRIIGHCILPQYFSGSLPLHIMQLEVIFIRTYKCL
jgi:hypothetical protein